MSEPVFLPLMREPQPDTAERKRREVQAIPWALPKKRELPDVSPSLAKQDVIHRLEVDAKCLGDGPLSACRLSNCANIGLRQSGGGVLASRMTCATCAPLPVPVQHVLGVRSEEKVHRSDAGTDIALMADLKAVWHGAMEGVPRSSVGAGRLGGALNSDRAVPVMVYGVQPQQASTVGFRDAASLKFAPESGIVYGIISHLTALLRRSLVRVGAVLQPRLRPAFSTIPSAQNKGVSPWR